MDLNLYSQKSVITYSLVWTVHCTDICGMLNMWLNRSGDELILDKSSLKLLHNLLVQTMLLVLS